jgi:tRNA threonylcarbamoyl adenosine modification protein YeaZ
MLTLAFDTSAAHCAAALLNGDRLIAAEAKEMTKGQAEQLMPMLIALLEKAGKTWADIDLLAVGTGPGNFTGLRISIAAARGLSLSTGVPAIGINTFDAMRRDAPDLIIAVPAPRDQVYLSRPGQDITQIPRTEAPENHVLPPDPADLVQAIARTAQRRDPAKEPTPAPLYLRPADAAPPRDAPPVIVP